MKREKHELLEFARGEIEAALEKAAAGFSTRHDGELGDALALARRLVSELKPALLEMREGDSSERGAQQAAVGAVMAWFYNVAALPAVRAIYGEDAGDGYLAEKMEVLLERGPARLWGELDLPHQRRVVDLALVKYGAHCAAELGVE